MNDAHRTRNHDTLHVAIDLGAGSGRALTGTIGRAGLRLNEVHRFGYAPRSVDGHLRWDVERLLDGVRTGLRLASEAARDLGAPLASIGVDAWGVDYALLDAEERLVEPPICYRDARTATAIDAVASVVPREELFARTGIQIQPFNTVYQLWAHVRDGFPERAAHLLLIPDLCHHMLCGSLVSERTNASTTQLLGAGTGRWDDEIFRRLALPRRVMPEVVAAATVLGTLRPAIGDRIGIGALAVVAPGTHDTSSAVAGTPLAPHWAFISSGTWSLVGVERALPLLSASAARAGLSNEVGVLGDIRLLTNVMGLWLLECCRREWSAAGRGQDLASLLAAVAEVPASAGVVYPDDHRFFAPASMVGEIRAALAETGQPDTDDPVRLTKVILDSLALRYADVVETIEGVTGTAIPGIHIVGGGSMNGYLNQATADASGRPVLAGPAEATATGNLLVQAMAMGAIRSLAEGRALVATAFPPARFEPRHAERWAGVARIYGDLVARVHAARSA